MAFGKDKNSAPGAMPPPPPGAPRPPMAPPAPGAAPTAPMGAPRPPMAPGAAPAPAAPMVLGIFGIVIFFFGKYL